MHENFIYENHLGQKFIGLENGVFLNANELRDYSWSYDVINNRISRFYKGVTPRKLPLLVCCSTAEEANEVRNRLLDVAEVDVAAMQPGKIYTGDYYTTGFITASKKTDYRKHGRYCRVDLTLTSSNPSWSKETVYVFGKASQEETTTQSGADFPFDYKYDYMSSNASRQVVCDTIRSNNFRLKIYGEAVNPSITINGNVYKVNGMVRADETLVVDSLNKTITLTTDTGEKVNWFNNRSRESYIFEPIAPGQADILYNGSFDFDLVIIEERSEPRWT